MKVHHRTARAALRYLRPPDIAAALGVTRETARLLMRRIPGAEMLYRTESGREKWRVSVADFEAWRRTVAA